MGCGSSSLKGSEDVGTDAPKPTVPNNNNLQPVGGAPMKQVRTNFSNIDYDAPAETHKGSLLKARAPDELDEGPSRNASYAAPTAGAVGGNLAGETKDGLTEHPAAESTPLEPYHTKSEENESEPTSGVGQHADHKTPNLVQ